MLVYLGVFSVLLVSIAFSLVGASNYRASGRDLRLGGRNLNKWAVGLSAGATGNSGFIVTAAVTLGYLFGTAFLFMPLAWLAGEIVFWRLYSIRLRAKAIASSSSSIVGILSSTLLQFRSLAILAVIGLVLYACSQVFVVNAIAEAALGDAGGVSFWVIIACVFAYTMAGGFLSTVYSDIFQAVMMLVLLVASFLLVSFAVEEISLSDEIWIPFFGWPWWASIAFIVTWGLTGFGFGMSQPQISERYIASANEEELRGAFIIYNLFLQVTWVGFTVIGVLLNYAVPGAGYDEGILLNFLSSNGGILAGILIGAIIAVVVSTLDSVIQSAGSLLTEIVRGRNDVATYEYRLGYSIFFIIVLGVFYYVPEESVFSLSSLAVTFLTASFTPSMVCKLVVNDASNREVLSLALVGGISFVFYSVLGVGRPFEEYFPRFELVPSLLTSAIYALLLMRRKSVRLVGN